MGSFPEAYQANTLSKSFGKGVQDSHGWVEPFCQSIVVSLESLDLLMNEGENCAGRGTGLELFKKLDVQGDRSWYAFCRRPRHC
jgi:hypothetical protein